ncbi:MAG: hypothetical protein GXP63_02460 [DPANN group archaeon]|nr:hypothetical protein [DPANN group archaeon]
MTDRKDVLRYFQALDAELTQEKRKINLYIIGGCYLMLQDIKPSSPDIDILVEQKDWTAINNAIGRLKHARPDGLKPFDIDLLNDRWLGEFQIPKNFSKDTKRYRRMRHRMKHLALYTLSPYDILISKIARWKKKDIDDINALLDKKVIQRHKLEKRIQRCYIPQKKTFKKHYDMFISLFGGRLKERSWF